MKLQVDSRRAAGARSARKAALLGCAFLLQLVATLGCAWEPMVRTGPERAVPPSVEVDRLTFGEPMAGTLDCPAGTCNGRYRLDIHDPGRIALKLTPAGKPEWIRMTLENPMQEVVARAQTEEGKVIALRLFVKRGSHFILIQSIGGQTEFELIAQNEPGGAPQGGPIVQPSRDILDRCLEEAPQFCGDVEDEDACIRRNRAGCWERFGGRDRGASAGASPTP